MNIRAGYRITFDCLNPTPITLKLSVHPERRGDLITPDALRTSRQAPCAQHADEFGNLVTRVRSPAGPITFSSEFLVEDSGLPDPQVPGAGQVAVEDLPGAVLPFLLPSRYCEADLLGDLAWSLFGSIPAGWARAQAITDYVHDRIAFSYPHACATRTAWQSHGERIGVCRDYAHLAIALCRAMNIPARYCTGYLGDIGVPPAEAPMDFSAWFEAYLDGRWRVFDARHNRHRIGRVLIARGRDAADVAMTHTFGQAWLTHFEVITEEAAGEITPGAPQGPAPKRLLAAE